MQFGKLHGYALIGLGFVFVIFFLATSLPHLKPVSPAPSTAQSTPAPRETSYIPLIPGVLCLCAGAYLVITQRKRGNIDEAQPKTTKSGLPM